MGEIVSAWLPKGFSWWLECDCAVVGRSISDVGAVSATVRRSFPWLERFAERLGKKRVCRRMDKRGAVALVAVVPVLACLSMLLNSCFSSSIRSPIDCSRLFLKQTRTRDRTAPIRRRIPIANPALPPTLMPPLLEAELAEAVVLAAASVAVAELVAELEEIPPLAARIPIEEAMVVGTDVMMVGRPVEVARVVGVVLVDLADVVSPSAILVEVFSELAGAVGVSELVSMATPKVE